MLLRKFAVATNSTLLMELSQEELSKESLQSLLHKLETESPDAVDAQDSELRKMCEAYEQERLGRKASWTAGPRCMTGRCVDLDPQS